MTFEMFISLYKLYLLTFGLSLFTGLFLFTILSGVDTIRSRGNIKHR